PRRGQRPRAPASVRARPTTYRILPAPGRGDLAGGRICGSTGSGAIDPTAVGVGAEGVDSTVGPRRAEGIAPCRLGTPQAPSRRRPREQIGRFLARLDAAVARLV